MGLVERESKRKKVVLVSKIFFQRKNNKFCATPHFAGFKLSKFKQKHSSVYCSSPCMVSTFHKIILSAHYFELA